jgi:hypothetical protein
LAVKRGWGRELREARAVIPVEDGYDLSGLPESEFRDREILRELREPVSAQLSAFVIFGQLRSRACLQRGL